MRYLGVDYGERKIGLALSDEGAKIAFPYATVRTVDDVCVAAKKEGVSRIVVGLPLPFKVRENQQVSRIREFAEDLKKKLQWREAARGGTALVVEFENELFTTKIAERHTARDKANASAAALILQSYLDRHRAR